MNGLEDGDNNLPLTGVETRRASPSAELAEQTGRVGGLLLIALLAMVAAGKSILADTMDPDAFWHVRVADELVERGLFQIGPITDRLSFASEPRPWTPYSYLAELFMRAVWNTGGFRGTIVVAAAGSAAFAVFLAAACRRFETSPNTPHKVSADDGRADTALFASSPGYTATAVTTAVGLAIALPYLSFRPATFALVLMAVVLWLLRRDSVANRATWLVVPITLLMTNLHLYSAVTAVVVLLWAIGSLIDNRRQFGRRCAIAGCTIAAACVTPMLPGAVTTALRYNAADPMVAGGYITEMQPFYTGFGGTVALVCVVGITLLMLWRFRQLSVTDWLFWALGMVLLLRLGRFAPIYVLLVLPIAARLLPTLSDRPLSRRPVRVALSAVLLMGVISLLVRFPFGQTFDAWLNRNQPTYPTAAANFVDAHVSAETGRLINEFNWGGYLEWRFAPSRARHPRQVLMDGRTQLFSPQFWQQTHLGDEATRANFLRSITADAAVLPAERSIFAAPLRAAGWREVYRDKMSVVLVP